jgi:membrane-associated HD superfamily phosphohydrolase
MAAAQDRAPWSRLIELAILLSLGALLFALYANGYLDRILGNTLSLWFFGLILAIILVVEAFAFTVRVVDIHFWSWLTTGLGMLGTVLGFSIALAGIDVKALHDPATLSAEIGQFLQTVSFAIDTTLIGLSAAMVMETMNKIREILSPSNRFTSQAVEEE